MKLPEPPVVVDTLAPLEVEALEDKLPVVWPLEVDPLEVDPLEVGPLDVVFVELESLLPE